MVKKEILNSLKPFKTSSMGKAHVAEAFPSLLANVCRSMGVLDMYGITRPVIHDWGKLMEFKVNLSTAIYSNNFDTLDNIIIEFFKTYNYKIVTPLGQLVMFKVDFTDESEKKFELICNDFKGKEWDEILESFIDALYDFLSSATIHGDSLVEWH